MDELNNHAPGLRAIKWHIDWIRRPVVGVALIALVLAALFAGTNYFASLLVFIVVTGAREWHRMVGGRDYLPEATLTVAVIVIALAALLVWPNPRVGWIILFGGIGASLIMSAFRKSSVLWQGGGILYLGIPVLAITSLHKFAPNGAWAVLGVFLSVWATDTGALVVGNLVGGPRIAPILSPNKTWAGTIGGVVAACIVQVIFIAVLGGNVWPAAIYGTSIAVTAHAGDLFESWSKRRFHIKDSGSLIPGHGGVLDRIDSTLAAGSFATLLVLVFGIDPLFGARL